MKRKLVLNISAIVAATAAIATFVSLHAHEPAHAGHAEKHDADTHSNFDGSHQMHAERSFEFVLPGTVAELTPLFGPVRESEWAPDWKPEFTYPEGGEQLVGAVFQTTSEWGTPVWVMDRYEPGSGKVGFVIFTHGIGVTRYDISLTQLAPSTVRVHVWCSRTAMKGADPKFIRQFEQSFVSQAPEWERAIKGILSH